MRRVSTVPDVEASPGTTLPEGFELRKLARRAIQVALLIGVFVLIVLLAPGLGEVRGYLRAADPWWVAVAIAFELLSCISYVLMFRPVFCKRMSWTMSSKIGWSELGVGAIVPASGAAGLALGAWALTQAGMSLQYVARRSVAFFTIKSSVNFVAVAVLGGVHGTVLPLSHGTAAWGLPLWAQVVLASTDASPQYCRITKVDGTIKIQFSPRPSASFVSQYSTINYDYVKKPVELSTDTDVPDVPDTSQQMAIVYLAVSDLLGKQGDVSGMTSWEVKAMRLLNAAHKVDDKKQGRQARLGKPLIAINSSSGVRLVDYSG